MVNVGRSRAGMSRLARRVSIALICTLAATGCISRQLVLPSVDQPPPTVGHEDGPIVGLAVVGDVPAGERAGAIGALGLTVGPDASAYVEAQTRKALQAKGFRVLTAPTPREPWGAGDRDVGTMLLLTLQSIHVESVDAAMEPTNATVKMSASLSDHAGKVVYAQVFYGEKTQRIGFVTNVPEVAGRILAAALDDAIEDMLADAGFLPAVLLEARRPANGRLRSHMGR